MAENKPRKLDYYQRMILLHRGLDPKNYTLVKSTYAVLYVRDKRDGRIRPINKHN